MIKDKLIAPETEDEIVSHWKYVDKVYVSCICITFNHENYIEDTINGMLAQKSDYKFEIIIHDDSSTDETRNILLKYCERYPSIIRLVLQDENQYSQGKKPITFVLPLCYGEFIAYCDGDDYWLDEKKITLQANYLQNHPNVSVSSHDAVIIDSKGLIIADSKLPNIYKRDFNSEELVAGKAWLLTLNWMFRRIDISDIHELNKVKNGDTFMTSIFGLHGESHHHEDIISSVHRHHESGVWSLISVEEKNDATINTYYWIYKYYKRVKQYNYANLYWIKYVKLVLLNTKLRDLALIFLNRFFVTEIKRLKKKAFGGN